MLWAQEGMSNLEATATMFNHTVLDICFCVVEAQLCNTPGLLLALHSLILRKVGVIFSWKFV